MLKLRETVLLEHFTYMVWLNLLYDEVDFLGEGCPRENIKLKKAWKQILEHS